MFHDTCNVKHFLRGVILYHNAVTSNMNLIYKIKVKYKHAKINTIDNMTTYTDNIAAIVEAHNIIIVCCF